MKPSSKEIKNFSPMTQEWLESGKFMQIEGKTIFTFDVGEGTPILLLHGHPSSSHDWKGAADQLKDRSRLISFDLVGYGLSEKPEAFSYSLFQQADIALGLIQKLGLKEVHVVSHDISTSIHTELLARAIDGTLPFKILSNTFLNGSILQWVSNEPPEQDVFQNNTRLFEGIKALEGIDKKMPEIIRGIIRKPVPQEKLNMIGELMGYRDGHLRLAAQSVYMRERYVHAKRWVGAMENTKPMRIIWAEDDPVANIQIGRELAQRIEHADFVQWKGAGHFPNFEDPDFVAKQIAISTGI
ncbi:alpha/beta fold hydrolase [Flammeovirga sp. EKP202]|uniref:alpha/beta fold hydrolase n=1 Tax=Flammeovirga sp. EKP202 TaxID=2770592 RepID=UPI00165F3A26|nr:alpha/beta hydrolase [Flammeovirga sp. EKP202]MBD0402975.1 alpha/beta hydrolase [Flammeovirga sp. EKP202]